MWREARIHVQYLQCNTGVVEIRSAARAKGLATLQTDRLKKASRRKSTGVGCIDRRYSCRTWTSFIKLSPFILTITILRTYVRTRDIRKALLFLALSVASICLESLFEVAIKTLLACHDFVDFTACGDWEWLLNSPVATTSGDGVLLLSERMFVWCVGSSCCKSCT